MTSRAARARPTWAEVDLDAIRHNVAVLAERTRPAALCAVVKADAYGHGTVEVARAALDAGATWLAVALSEEAGELATAGIHAPTILLAEPTPDELPLAVRLGLHCTVYHDDTVADLDRLAGAAGRVIDVHLKIDTGMHRVGCTAGEAPVLAKAIAESANLRLTGVLTHCAVADEPANPFTDHQLDEFDATLAELASAGLVPRVRHAANSAATLRSPRAHYDLVRCGIAVYGLAPSPEMTEQARGLRPAMALKSRVSHVQRVPAGDGISYGHRYRPDRDTWVATVPAGYADGVPRRLGATGGEVLIGGRRRPIAGNITMDQLLVDCGDDPPTRGDEVVLIGAQGDECITADDWAARLDTISYEIVCGIGSRVPRVHLGEGAGA